MSVREVLTFYPKQFAVQLNENNTAAESCFEPEPNSEFAFENVFRGAGGFAHVYMVEDWLVDHASSFHQRQYVLDKTGERRIVTKPDFNEVSSAALKVFDGSGSFVRADFLDAIQKDQVSIQSVEYREFLQSIKPPLEEYERLCFANGANGHVPKPYAIGWVHKQDGYYPAILMEWLPSKDEFGNDILTTEALLKKINGDPMAVAQAGIELCKAVRCLHDTGIAHRDLSEGNVSFSVSSKNGSVIVNKAYIFDLGNSVKRNQNITVQLDCESNEYPRLATLGTGSPEVFSVIGRWHLYSHRNRLKTDAYSLACLLYILRTGSKPPSSEIPRPTNLDKDSDEFRQWALDYNRWIDDSFPEDGIILPSRCNTKEDGILREIIQQCSIRDPDYRRDEGWMLAKLWEMVYPQIASNDSSHYSNFVDQRPMQAHSIDVNPYDNDPLSSFRSNMDLYFPRRQPEEPARHTANAFTNDTSRPSSTLQADDMVVVVSRFDSRRPSGANTSAGDYNVGALLRAFYNAPHPRTSDEVHQRAVSMFKSAQRAFENNKPLDGLDRLKIAKDRGYSPAAVELAWWYYKGNVFGQSEPKLALHCLEDALESGCQTALSGLALLLCRGDGTMKDESAALTLLLAGEERGDICCISNLGYFYWHGIGVEPDHRRAVKYFAKATEAGNELAALNLWYVCNTLQWPDWIDYNMVTRIVNSTLSHKALGDAKTTLYLWEGHEL